MIMQFRLHSQWIIANVIVKISKILHFIILELNLESGIVIAISSANIVTDVKMAL